MQENKMGVMPVPRLVVTMSLPVMVSMVVQSMYNIVDSIFVARLSETALTATSIAYSAQMLQIAAAVGTGVGINALVSRRLGAGDSAGANEAATTGLLLTLLSSAVFIVWGIFWTEPFIRFFTDDEAIISNGVTYLRICQVWAAGIFLATFAQRLLQSTGRTFHSMLAQMAGALVNLILDPVMIFGLLGCPAMGIAGAAIATVIGQWTSAVIGLVLNHVQNKEIRFVFRGYCPRLPGIVPVYKVGAPTILTQAFGSIMVAAMNVALAPFSSTAVALFGVYFKLQSFLMMPLNGLGQATLSIVSYNFGARKPQRVRQAYRTAVFFGLVIASAGMAAFSIFPDELLGLFAASPLMKQMGIPALRTIAPSLLPASVTMIIGYTLSGLGNGFPNMMAAALRQLIVLLPCAVLFGRAGGIGAVWFAFWIAEGSALAFALYQLRRGTREKF